jgi:Zn-dependent M28 family amino/carboxypeptidase
MTDANVLRTIVALSLVLHSSAAAQNDAPASAARDTSAALESITAPHVRAHLGFLADDVLEGRAPGTRGGDLAAHYVATRFERIGLQPVDGSYFQSIPFTAWKPLPDSIVAEFGARERRTVLRYPDDFVLWTESAARSSQVSADVVFVGFGIVAPEFGWNDYGPIDVRGKVVLILSGEPASPPDRPDLFDGEHLTIHGRWNTKLEEAGRRGAAAALLIHSPGAAGYAWSVVESSWTGERLSLSESPGLMASVPVLGWIREGAARALAAAGNRSLTDLTRLASTGRARPVPLGVRFLARIAGERRTFESPNVIGILPGSDARSDGEQVVVIAHYDHLGIGPPVGGDSIYNGAYDNASGVAVLLEVAEALTVLERAPARSVLFLATTAEEAGLLGARHYVRNPVVPIAQTVAAINIDGASLWGETRDMIALGGNRSTLGETVRTRARHLGRFAVPEPAPEKGLFFRTDQAPFARAGVPAVAIQHGTDFVDRPPGWGATFLARWEALNYHRPSDELPLDADLSGAVLQARLALLVVLDAASGPRPRPYRPPDTTRQ